MAKPYFIYLLRCRDGSLYTGITNDLEARLKCHQAGKGAKYVRSRLPVALVYSEQVGKKGTALAREAEIKKLTKAQKEKFISKPKNCRKSAPRKKKTPFWSEGIRFECQGTGQCCLSRHGYGYVYLTAADRKRLATHFLMSMAQFTKTFCDRSGGYVFFRPSSPEVRSPLKEKGCRFLVGKRCAVYEARPIQCRTWPFWPENMNAKTWNREVVRDCAGVGKGRLFSAAEIRKLLKQHT